MIDVTRCQNIRIHVFCGNLILLLQVLARPHVCDSALGTLYSQNKDAVSPPVSVAGKALYVIRSTYKRGINQCCLHAKNDVITHPICVLEVANNLVHVGTTIECFKIVERKLNIEMHTRTSIPLDEDDIS